MWWQDVLFAIWFFLPAGVANMTPVFSARIPWLRKFEQPMDFGKSFRGHRVFGSHKTWRGFVTGILAATLILWLQQQLYLSYGWAETIAHGVDYGALPVLVLGPLFGVGALLGDAIESFFKRQRGVKPGDGWFPWDQTDYIIGGAIATMPFVQLSLLQYLWLLVLWLGVHLIASYIGYLLGLKDKPI